MASGPANGLWPPLGGGHVRSGRVRGSYARSVRHECIRDAYKLSRTRTAIFSRSFTRVMIMPHVPECAMEIPDVWIFAAARRSGSMDLESRCSGTFLDLESIEGLKVGEKSQKSSFFFSSSSEKLSSFCCSTNATGSVLSICLPFVRLFVAFSCVVILLYCSRYLYTRTEKLPIVRCKMVGGVGDS